MAKINHQSTSVRHKGKEIEFIKFEDTEHDREAVKKRRERLTTKKRELKLELKHLIKKGKPKLIRNGKIIE